MSTRVGLSTFVSVSTEHVTLSLYDVSDDVLSDYEDKILVIRIVHKMNMFCHVRNSDIDENDTDVPVKPTWVLLILDYSGARFSYTGDEL